MQSEHLPARPKAQAHENRSLTGGLPCPVEPGVHVPGLRCKRAKNVATCGQGGRARAEAHTSRRIRAQNMAPSNCQEPYELHPKLSDPAAASAPAPRPYNPLLSARTRVLHDQQRALPARGLPVQRVQAEAVARGAVRQAPGTIGEVPGQCGAGQQSNLPPSGRKQL